MSSDPRESEKGHVPVSPEHATFVCDLEPPLFSMPVPEGKWRVQRAAGLRHEMVGHWQTSSAVPHSPQPPQGNRQPASQHLRTWISHLPQHTDISCRTSLFFPESAMDRLLMWDGWVIRNPEHRIDGNHLTQLGDTWVPNSQSLALADANSWFYSQVISP